MLAFTACLGGLEASSERNPAPAISRRVYRIRQALIAFPSWSPRVHARLAVVLRDGETKGDQASDGKAASRKGAHNLDADGPTAMLLDLIPEKPFELQTLLNIALGQEKAAVVRTKIVRWPPKRNSGMVYAFLGASRKSDAEIKQFVNEYPKQISRGNNCEVFERKCISFLFSDESLDTVELVQI
jgi:hypothetical protein